METIQHRVSQTAEGATVFSTSDEAYILLPRHLPNARGSFNCHVLLYNQP